MSDTVLPSPKAQPFTIAAGTRFHGVVRLEPPFRTWPCHLRDVSGGAFSYIAPGAALTRTSLGRYCSIGDHVSILSRHPTEGLTTSPVLYQRLFGPPFESMDVPGFDAVRDTRIGNDVWIGAGVQIKTGVTIGDGAVIGAGSVVTRDVAPYAVVAGAPARVIRQRFPDAVVERLHRAAWWRYNIVGLPLHGKAPEQALDVIEEALTLGLVQYEPGYARLWNEGANGAVRGCPEKDYLEPRHGAPATPDH
ncbi:antibiotic acetyltransferase [Duganella sp. FT94W]|uniref:Antibiotic acetyltransferase n=1 Tax=Duganella lactea TaxID=2692173 RepID=A0ABW9VA71_9BURK|nr:antibiotic acetyltransferase [Duganella lactea]